MLEDKFEEMPPGQNKLNERKRAWMYGWLTWICKTFALRELSSDLFPLLRPPSAPRTFPHASGQQLLGKLPARRSAPGFCNPPLHSLRSFPTASPLKSTCLAGIVNIVFKHIRHDDIVCPDVIDTSMQPCIQRSSVTVRSTKLPAGTKCCGRHLQELRLCGPANTV